MLHVTYSSKKMVHCTYSFEKFDPRFAQLATLIETTVAIIAGTLLPYLAARDRRLLKPTSEKLRDGEIGIENEDEEDEEHVEMERIREMVQQWKAEAAREGRPLKLPTSKYPHSTFSLPPHTPLRKGKADHHRRVQLQCHSC